MEIIHSIVEVREGDIVEFHREQKSKYKGILSLSSELVFGEVRSKFYDTTIGAWVLEVANDKGTIIITEEDFIKALR